MSVQVDHAGPPASFAPTAPTAETADAGPLRSQWWLVGVLTLLAMLGAIDRQVFSLLANPIKADLKLSDTQISLVYGAAFGLSNVLFAIPAGWLADRASRKGLVGLGAAVWSALSMACGLVGGFGALFAVRAGVGFGESVIQPCSVSLIRHGVEPGRRGRAFSVFGTANLLGSAFAMLAGGALMAGLSAAHVHSLPILGETRPWRMVLIIMGLIGLPLALLALSVREPPHQRAETGGLRYADALGYMRRHWTVFAPLLTFQTTFTMLGLAYGAWLAAMVGRNYGLTPQQVGLTLGPIMLVFPPIGLWVVGVLVDRRTRTHGRTAPVSIGLVATLATAAFAVIAPLLPTLRGFLPVFVLHMLVGSAGYVVMTSVAAAATPGRNLGKVIAIMYAISNLLAAVFGPMLVALASDRLFHGPRALASGLAWVSGGYGVAATLSLLVLLSTLKRSNVSDR